MRSKSFQILRLKKTGLSFEADIILTGPHFCAGISVFVSIIMHMHRRDCLKDISYKYGSFI